MTTEANIVTELDITVDAAGYERDLLVAVWWDPEDDTLEHATLRVPGSDTDEELPIGVLLMLADRDDLLDALHYEHQTNPPGDFG